MDSDSFVQWVNGGLLMVAVIALIFNARAVIHQYRATDFSNYLELTKRFSEAWRRIVVDNPGPYYHYEYAELLNLIESTCHLYNKNRIGKATKEMIEDYLNEILRKMLKDEKIKKKIVRELESGPSTFKELKQFCKKHGIDIPVE